MSLIAGTVAGKCCVITRAPAKKYFSRNVLGCSLRLKADRPRRGTSLQDKEKFVRKRRYAKINQTVQIRRTIFEDERRQKYLKERWAKLSQKIEDASAFKKLKDGQSHVRKSRWRSNTKTERWANKVSLKLTRVLNDSE
jgi:hypothetical protein